MHARTCRARVGETLLRDLGRPLPLGCVLLAAGFAVYALARPLAPTGASSLLLGSAPTFLHAAAFTLLTAAVAGPGEWRAAAACLGWMTVNCVLELGQHPTFAPHWVAALPPWFEHVPVFDRVGPYFAHGTFDVLDLAAAVAGACLGWLCLTQRAAPRAGRSS